MKRNQIALPAIALCLGGCAHKPVTPAVPVPVVNALLADQLVGIPPRYSVGVLPDEFPLNLRPQRVRIVGGMTSGDMTVGVFADSARPLTPVFETLFAQAGMRHPAATPASGFSRGYGGEGFCSDSAMAFAKQAPRDPSMTIVTLRRLNGYNCFSDERTGPELILPALTPPPGVRVGRSGSSSGMGVSSQAEMTGRNLVPGEMLHHYAAQLVAAGWMADAPIAGDRVAAQFFEARNAAGQPWEGTMVVVGRDSALSLTLNMHPGRR